MSDLIVYTSDSHFGHANIIRYCRRPFPSTAKMDAALAIGLKDADQQGKRIYHGGDIAFSFAKVLKAHGTLLKNPAQHTFLFGNHDEDKDSNRAALYSNFGLLVGAQDTWRENTLIIADRLNGEPVSVLLSHAPQKDLQGCDYNVFGHIHNNAIQGVLVGRGPGLEFGYTFESPQHLNMCVELHDYAPVSLEALVKAHTEKYPRAFAALQSAEPTAVAS